MLACQIILLNGKKGWKQVGWNKFNKYMLHFKQKRQVYLFLNWFTLALPIVFCVIWWWHALALSLSFRPLFNSHLLLMLEKRIREKKIKWKESWMDWYDCDVVVIIRLAYIILLCAQIDMRIWEKVSITSVQIEMVLSSRSIKPGTK